MDREVRIADVTMRQAAASSALSFKEKLELSKLIDRVGASVIEIEGIENPKVDSLRIKSIASAVKNSTVAAPVKLDRENADAVWAALCEAKSPRLQVVAAVSPMQMEYIFHKKPDAMLASIADTVKYCASLTPDVEFVADDAARGDEAFLYAALSAAVEAGAKTVTLCDAAGAMLPEEFGEFVKKAFRNVPSLSGVRVGVQCDNAMFMADACLIAAVAAGARELKAAMHPDKCASLPAVAKVLADRGESFGIYSNVRSVEMKRISQQIESIFRGEKGKAAAAAPAGQQTPTPELTKHDDKEAVLSAAAAIGYELSEEDGEAVWAAFQTVTERRERIDARELDAIIAAAAMQVPATYTLKTYTVNAGNMTGAMASVTLLRGETALQGIASGDGPIDAAFLALEQATGNRYELDDFQVRSITEGQGAMGETVVRLVSGGKRYGGRGVSTDIVGASIAAYISALNKIAYEEAQV